MMATKCHCEPYFNFVPSLSRQPLFPLWNDKTLSIPWTQVVLFFTSTLEVRWSCSFSSHLPLV